MNRHQNRPFTGRWPKFALASLACWPAAVIAGETGAIPDKSQYNLFNPTPSLYLRELQPDRPDKTESPYTLDAGHYQVEMDFANYTYTQGDGVTTRAWNVAPVNLKAGLCNKVDLQFVYDSYLHVRTSDRNAGTVNTQSGVGDLTTRLKVNLWGNDDGQTAFALLPYLKIPTSTDRLGNDSVEGGIILPLAIKLPGNFDLAVETAASCLRNTADSGYHAEVIASASLDHNIVGNLSSYAEFFSSFSTEAHSGWVGTVDFGLEYAVTKNIQLDCGCNFGITHSADDYNPFAGITVRF